MAETNTATGKGVTPESIAASAAAQEDAESKAGGAKHFDQPGVRFSFQELRDRELARREKSGESFRQHVEVALLTLTALHDCTPAEFTDFRKEIKFNDWDNDPKNKVALPQLKTWLTNVQSGARTGGGQIAASAAREAALRKEIDDLKATVKKLTESKAK